MIQNSCCIVFINNRWMHASARSVSSRTLSLPDKNLQPQINLKKKNQKNEKKKKPIRGS